MRKLCLVYYCSGHGYGHATRVCAFASKLLSIEPKPVVYIVSSAPQHVFSKSIGAGALYRYAEIDPIVVQPLAYMVDRQKSVDVLKAFLKTKNAKLQQERQWLLEIDAQCVLSDAAFLGCLAARAANLPSILVTNFTFDSVYSYLSTTLLESAQQKLHPLPQESFDSMVSDVPIPPAEVAPLVQEILEGYQCADLLILLPGAIPIPSFPGFASLPATDWVNPLVNKFHNTIVHGLDQLPTSARASLHPRTTIRSPLLVRKPTTNPSPFTTEGRSKLLSSIGVPEHFHDPEKTKILIVSFGGQVIRKPNRSGSRTPSPRTRESSPLHDLDWNSATSGAPPLTPSNLQQLSVPGNSPPRQLTSPRLATPSHIWIPGAPPASKPLTTPPPSTTEEAGYNSFTLLPESNYVPIKLETTSLPSEREPQLLPDDSWIAIVCGVSKEQWKSQSEGDDDEMPERFFVAPRDVYMPDLTAIGDVLLGKLGYGTTSECVDSCTPFVYVSRPLFIEEHGLRLLLERSGVGVELSRLSYEAGDWAIEVERAWQLGRLTKAQRRKDWEEGMMKEEKDDEMARTVINWIEEWWEVEKQASFKGQNFHCCLQ